MARCDPDHDPSFTDQECFIFFSLLTSYFLRFYQVLVGKSDLTKQSASQHDSWHLDIQILLKYLCKRLNTYVNIDCYNIMIDRQTYITLVQAIHMCSLH